MEKENKKKVTPDINEEFMMNLMVDGVKKEGLQLARTSERSTETEAEKPKELPREKPVIRKEAEANEVPKPITKVSFSGNRKPMPVTGKRFISVLNFTKS
jgi:hypothetical protein